MAGTQFCNPALTSDTVNSLNFINDVSGLV